MDNPFDTPTTGAADWDSGLFANFQAIERGYHVTERAGTAINTGDVLTMTQSGFFYQYNPNSTGAYPHALAYHAAASGETMAAVAWGIMRSLDINSWAIPGKVLYGSSSTPGLMVTSDAIASDRPIGIGLDGRGVLFLPVRSPVSGGGGGVTEIQSLSDVDASGFADKKSLRWVNASSKFVAVDDTLQNLTDVNATGLGDGKAPVWSNTSSKFVMTTVGGGGGSSTLGGLTDVDTTNLQDNAILVWSNTTSKWEQDFGITEILARAGLLLGNSYVNTVEIVTHAGSLHTFGPIQIDPSAINGTQYLWNRRVRINGMSNSCELKLYSSSLMNDLQYSTLSGGVSAANSFMDRAGFPMDMTLNGDFIHAEYYGTLKTFDVSTTIDMIFEWGY